MLQPLVDTLRSAARSLGANKLRSLLTLLGIVIGVVAVVAMAATTEGLRRKINADLAQLGTGVFQIQKWPVGGFGPGNRNWAKIEKRKNFTMAEVRLLQEKCEQCLRVAGEAWRFGQKLTANDKSTRPGVVVAGGSGPAFFDNNGYGLSEGRSFDEGEALSGSYVIVLGADVTDVLFPDSNPIGQHVRIGDDQFRVIGRLERRGPSMDGSQDNVAFVPLATFLTLYGPRQSLNVTVQVRDPERMERAQDEVVAILRRSRAIPPEAENDFEMFSNQSMQDSFEEIAGSISAGSIGICAIGLLIGGIGVMNIMLVSVTERTSEVGVRRALGARRRRILAQFMVEAITLCSIGGLIGVALGTAVAMLVKILVGIPTVVPAWAVVISMIVSGGVGLLFGIYPAWRASQLDPVEAMRHE